MGGTTLATRGLNIPAHDYYANTYTDGNLTQTVYRQGGSTGVIVATVTNTYDGSDRLLTVTRS